MQTRKVGGQSSYGEHLPVQQRNEGVDSRCCWLQGSSELQFIFFLASEKQKALINENF